jgi:hypothetical protein
MARITMHAHSLEIITTVLLEVLGRNDGAVVPFGDLVSVSFPFIPVWAFGS